MSKKTYDIEILVYAPNDVVFVRRSEGSIVTGMRLPSGFKLPSAPVGKHLIVRHGRIVLEQSDTSIDGGSFEVTCDDLDVQAAIEAVKEFGQSKAQRMYEGDPKVWLEAIKCKKQWQRAGIKGGNEPRNRHSGRHSMVLRDIQ